MRIIHLNTSNAGGSWVYARTLSDALREAGHDSVVVNRELTDRPWSDKVLRKASLAMARGAWHGTRRTLPPPSDHIIEGADVVHLHTVADWFDVPRWVATLPERIRVVIGLHDLWHISGGCFVYDSCEGFQEGCPSCPRLKFPASRILAKMEGRRKRRAYRDCKATFVANSGFLARLAASSTIAIQQDIRVIAPPIDNDAFYPRDQAECRWQLGVPLDASVVAVGCASLSDKNKDISGLLHLLADIDDSRLHVLLFGDGSVSAPPRLRIIWLGPMYSKEKLATVYGAADVHATASRMETYGLTLVESLACSTPVVAFDVGGIPEAVAGSSCERYLCPPYDRNALRSAIVELLQKRHEARAMVHLHGKEFRRLRSPSVIAKAHEDLYRQACRKRQTQGTNANLPCAGVPMAGSRYIKPRKQ